MRYFLGTLCSAKNLDLLLAKTHKQSTVEVQSSVAMLWNETFRVRVLESNRIFFLQFSSFSVGFTTSFSTKVSHKIGCIFFFCCISHWKAEVNASPPPWSSSVHLSTKRHINLDVKPPLGMLSGFPITIELSKAENKRGGGKQSPLFSIQIRGFCGAKQSSSQPNRSGEKRLVSSKADNRF